MTPRVSVIVPTRNRLAKLRRALAGIKRQRFRDFDLIVVDDGSEDATIPWLRTHCPGTQVLEMGTSGGAARARNRGLEAARGELVAFLDDDDVWQPQYLEAQVAHVDAYPTATLSYCDHIETDTGGHSSRPDTQPLFTYSNPLLHLLTESFIHTLSVVVCRREAFDRFGRFNESLRITHDLEWYRRILAGGGHFVHLPRSLVVRETPGGLVTSHRHWFEEERAVHKRAFIESPAYAMYERMVYAYRALFFARVGLAVGDVRFGLARLTEAFRTSPYWTLRIAALRLLRRRSFARQVIP